MLYALSPVPLLSVGALQDKFTCPQLAAVAVRPVGDVGGTLCATAGALLSTIRTAKSNALPQIWGEQILFFIGIPCFGHDDGVDRTKRDDGRTVPEVHLGRRVLGIVACGLTKRRTCHTICWLWLRVFGPEGSSDEVSVASHPVYRR